MPIPNPDLWSVTENERFWNRPNNRRFSWHNLHKIVRYCSSYRAAYVMPLEKRMDLGIAGRPDVLKLCALPWFSAMVVTRGSHILFERYAPDFLPGQAHSIQSITKTFLNLIIGRLVENRVLDIDLPVDYFIPEIGSGYAKATLQQVLNMDVVNDYTEDFDDPQSTYYLHEEVMGWRLHPSCRTPSDLHEFLAKIKSTDITNTEGVTHYKDANTDVLGWVIERSTGTPLRQFLAEIADATGVEDVLYVTTDRNGTPWLSGGACMTARDLARYFSIFARKGLGFQGNEIGSAAFLQKTLTGGVPKRGAPAGFRYCNHLQVIGSTVMHGGWGGQFAVANLDTGIVAVFLSVLENENASTSEYWPEIAAMLIQIAETNR